MRRVVAFAAALAALAVVPLASSPPPAAAFPLTTCTLSITTYDAARHVLSSASETSAVGSTEDNPVIVDPNGYVEYTASTGGRSLDRASYHLEVFGMPTPIRGTIANANSTWSDRIFVADIFPFSFQGTVFVSGALEANGTTICAGSAWVKIDGNPLPGALGGIVTMLIGFAGALWASRGRHPFRGILSGAVFGAGLAVLTGTIGLMPLKENTPVGEIIASLVTGFAIGAIDLTDVFGTPAAALRRSTAEDARSAAIPYTPPANPYGLPDGLPIVPPPPPPTIEPAPSWLPPTDSGTGTSVGIDPALAAGAAAATTAAATVVATEVRPEAGVPVPAGGPAPVTETTSGAEPAAGLPQLQKWEQSLDPKVRKSIGPVFGEAQNILRTGPGSLSISGQLINDFGAQATIPVKLADGAILVGDGMARAVPFVENGKLSISLVNANSSTLEFLAGTVAEGLSSAGRAVGGPDPLQPLRWFVDNVNAAVTNAGQSIQSIKVTSAGIQVTTCPAGR